MFCSKCGNQLNPNHKFCTKCGDVNIIYNAASAEQQKAKGNKKFLIAAIILLVIAILLFLTPILMEAFIYIFWFMAVVLTLGIILIANPSVNPNDISLIYIICHSLSMICLGISILLFVKYSKSKKAINADSTVPMNKQKDD